MKDYSLQKQNKMDKEKERPDMQPNKSKPNEVSEKNVKDVPEIQQQELPDELHKETNPDRGTEKIQDSIY